MYMHACVCVCVCVYTHILTLSSTALTAPTSITQCSSIVWYVWTVWRNDYWCCRRRNGPFPTKPWAGRLYSRWKERR